MLRLLAVGRMRMSSEDQILRRIITLFEQELETTGVEADTHFIFSGGDSLNAESLVAAICTEFAVKIKTATILDAPTPREMTQLVMRLQAARAPAVAVP
jgi:acyl carrier protein